MRLVGRGKISLRTLVTSRSHPGEDLIELSRKRALQVQSLRGMITLSVFPEQRETQVAGTEWGGGTQSETRPQGSRWGDFRARVRSWKGVWSTFLEGFKHVRNTV